MQNSPEPELGLVRSQFKTLDLKIQFGHFRIRGSMLNNLINVILARYDHRTEYRSRIILILMNDDPNLILRLTTQNF